uniref:Uncharacterized protein n=1 Tax=Tanacetum cinerariifolium TaxID=118510 RepID=A0A699JUS2_TANCI|nr:hypothetical protein [Tanacetum cinerariifolium]
MLNSISVSRTQTKTIIASMQHELQDTINENAKLRAQLFNKVSEQKDITCGKSANTKFAKRSILRKPPKVGETHALSKPVTSNSIPILRESKVVKTDQVIQIHLWCVDSGCSKHMTENLKLLINFVWKFLGIVRFGNDHVVAILGFGDSDLEVAFRRNARFIRNLEGVDLLKGNRSTNLYIINLHEMASASPICLMARASSTKSWLWNQRLSHLNFDTINDLTNNDLVTGLPKFKYHKEHLRPSCEQGKSKRASHPSKPFLNSSERLHLLHTDLCGPMRIASINGKRCVLVIVDDYSRYTWTLVEAARTMLIFSRASLFLWAEAIATAYFTQNRSIIHRRFNKTPYELIKCKKPDISFLYVFRALCYPKNDREDIGKLSAKETMNVTFDELSAMAFKQHSSKLRLQSMTSGQISLGLDLTYAPSTITTQQPTEGELDLFFKAMYDDYIGGQLSAAARTVMAAQAPQVRQTSSTSTSLVDTAPTPTVSSSQATNFPNTLQDIDELNSQLQHAQQQGNQAPIQPKQLLKMVQMLCSMQICL